MEQEKARRRLNTYIFLMAIGFFILMPVLSFQLLLRPGMDAGYVTALNNIRYVCQDAVMIPCALAGRRIRAKKLLASASVIRGMGFFLFALSGRGALALAAALTGLGGGLFFPAAMTLYMEATEEKNRIRVFAKREMLNSLGAILGPLFCWALLKAGFSALCLAAGAIYMGCAVFSAAALPDNTPARAQKREARGERTALSAAGLILLILMALLAVWQNQQSVMLAVCAQGAGYNGIEWVNMATFALMALAQLPVSDWCGKKFGLSGSLALSAMLFTIGAALLFYGKSIFFLYLGNVVFAMGTVLFMPAKNGAFARLGRGWEAGMMVGVHGILSSVGGIAFGAGFGKVFASKSAALWGALLLCGVALSALLIIISPRAVNSKQ